MSAIRTGIRAAMLAEVAFLIYGPVLRGGWLWDDTTEVLNNALVKDPHGLGKIWLGQGTPDYFPLKTSVQWLEWRLWGPSVVGYHAVSLALHVIAALLVWRLLHELGCRAAYLGGLLFVAHPLAVESVAWISELKNTLSLPLLLVSFIAFVRYDRQCLEVEATSTSPSLPAREAVIRAPSARAEERRRRGRRPHFNALYVISLGLFLLSLLAKPAGAAFPLVLLLYCLWRRGRLRKADFAAAAPFLLLTAALSVVAIHFQTTRVIARVAMPPESALSRIAGAGWAIWFYLEKCLWPTGLLPIYPRWALSPALLWFLPPWIALAGAFFFLRNARTVFFAIATFVVNLLPIIGLVPMAYLRISRVSDHLAYFSLVSIVALAAAAASAWMRREEDRPMASSTDGGSEAAPESRSVSPGVAIVWVVGLLVVAAGAAASRAYAAHFVSEEALWEYTIARNPRAWLAQNNLGILLAQSGQFAEAIPHLEAAVQENPLLLEAQINLGRALSQEGKLADAAPHFAAALKLDPGNTDARGSLRACYNNEANALARAGRLEEAVALFRKALAVDPTNAGVHRNLAYALHALGRDAEAMKEMQAAQR